MQENIAGKIKSDQQNLAVQNLYKHYPALLVKHLNKALKSAGLSYFFEWFFGKVKTRIRKLFFKIFF